MKIYIDRKVSWEPIKSEEMQAACLLVVKNNK